MPLNVWVTINFALATVAAHDAVGLFARLRTNHFNKWARRHATPFSPTYAYAFENANRSVGGLAADDEHNTHVHWLLHVPPRLLHEFEYLLPSWLDFVTGRVTPLATAKTQSITDTRGARRYLLKGAAAGVASRFGAYERDQGIVVGRRSGVSRNLGPMQRRAFDRAAKITRAAVA